jgi:hypothetical protein
VDPMKGGVAHQARRIRKQLTFAATLVGACAVYGKSYPMLVAERVVALMPDVCGLRPRPDTRLGLAPSTLTYLEKVWMLLWQTS